MRLSELLVLGSMLFVSGILGAQDHSSGPKIYPAAMSMDYNPLLWQDDDAQFARDMLHSSYCTAELSKAVAVNTQNSAVQSLALSIADEQKKIFRQLRSMARTLYFPLPHKRDLENCPAASRVAELSGQEMDSAYVALLLTSTAENVSRFEAEVARPRSPSNWSLWKFAEKGLPVMRGEETAAKDVQRAIPTQK